MKPDQIHTFFSRLRAANPHPQTELNYASVFELLAAVLLSAQATDVGVNKATARLFVVANTPQKIINLGLAGLERHIQTIGLFRSKARHLMQTANVVLNVALGEPTIAVDTHIFRLGNRTGLAPGKTPLEVERKLLKRIPPEFLVDAHHWLILHGRYVCQARKPLCGACGVVDACGYRSKASA